MSPTSSVTSPHASDERHFEHAANALPHILWTALPDGRVDYVSKTYAAYTGMQTDMAHQAWLKALHPDDVEACLAVWRAAVLEGQDYNFEFRVIHRASGRYRWHAVNAKPIKDEAGRIVKWYGICIDIEESKSVENQAAMLSARLHSTLENMSDAFFMLDREWRFAYLNSAAEREIGYGSKDLLGKDIRDVFPAEVYDRFYRHYRIAIQENCAARFEEFYARLNKWFELNAYPSEQGISVYFRDITERKQADLALERTSRGLRMLSHANAALVRIDDEEELLQAICRAALDGGDYRAAWAGIAQDDATQSIKVPAWAGDEAIARYIDGLQLSWSDATPYGLGPTGRAIRANKPMVFSDTTTDPSFAPWRESAVQTNYLSGVCLPLHDKVRTFGVLVLVNYGKRIVSEEEVRLLQELADNLSFGIAHIRAQKRQRQMESAMVKVAASISTSSGTEFFKKLAVSMAEATGADCAFLSQFLPGTTPPAARVIAGVINGDMVDDIRYEVDGTPCQIILDRGACIIPEDLYGQFPVMAEALPPGMIAGAGHRLDDANGHALGTLFMVFPKKIEQPDFVRSMMQIFAARAAAEMERQEKEAQIHYQASLIDKARDAFIVRDMEHRIILWSQGAERLYGWSSDEVLGRTEDEFLYESPATYHRIVDQVLADGKWSGELTKRHRDGSKIILDSSWTLVRDESGETQSIFSIHTDISDRKAAENEIQRLAFYDQLTCLPNRQLLRDRLMHAVRSSTRTHRQGALMFLDLDNFKELNDIYGHHRGDILLQRVAARLIECVRASDTVARLGGDEFVLVLEELTGDALQAARVAEQIAEKVRTSLNEPYEIEGCQHISTPSIGVVLFDGGIDDIDELLKCADLAMYKAKAAGRNAIQFYDPDMQAAVIEKVALEGDLRESIEKNLFALHYQPQMDSHNRIIGVEALVRWMHPKRLGVPPSMFIPLAEETRLILGLGRRVLESACRQLKSWACDPSTASLTLAVNVSARQFHHPSFVTEVMDIVRESGIDPAKLKLELTESVLVEDVTEAAAKMVELQSLGIGFSLDDFGTGYSSLSYLRRLPLEQLKIDRSFIAELPGNENDVSIVEAIIALGRKLRLNVIAEGVETSGQRDFLCSLGCHAYQGYFYSHPLDAETFSRYLHDHHAPPEKIRYC